MGDPICKWRKVSTENIIEMVSWLPKKVCTESEYKSHMLQLPIGKAFLRTACQLSCQLGLQYVDVFEILLLLPTNNDFLSAIKILFHKLYYGYYTSLYSCAFLNNSNKTLSLSVKKNKLIST